MNTLHAEIALCAPMVLMLFAMGFRTFQSRLEQWDYNRHFDD